MPKNKKITLKNIIMFLLLFISFLLFINLNQASGTLVSEAVVSKNSTCIAKNNLILKHYKSIQEAIDDAEKGSEIIICAGEYEENVEINKSLRIKGEKGAIIRAKEKYRAAVSIKNAGNILISNIEISGSDFAGIEITNSENITVKSSIIKANYYGVDIYSSSKITFKNNTMINNSFGFILRGSKKEHFDNDIENNEIDGKKLYYLKNAENLVIGSDAASVYCISCDNITIENASLERNAYGIFFLNTNNSRIKNCKLNKNNDYGIYMILSNNNTIEKCELSYNGAYGAYVESSFNNTFAGNKISGNALDGISLYISEGNMVTGNKITENRYGLTLVYLANNNKIINNTIKNSRLYNLYVYNSFANFFSGNIFENGPSLNESSENLENKLFLVANSIDKALAGDFFEFLRTKNYNVFVFNSSYFDGIKRESLIIILGGPDAYEGIGKIVRHLINESEQQSIREKGAKKVIEIKNKFTNEQRIIIFAGSDRNLTREAWEENAEKFL